MPNYEYSNLRPAIPSSQCDVTYNLRNLPSTLSESGYLITLDYDASGMRRHTEVTNGQTLVKEKTRISDLYELETTPTTSRRLDYVYAEGRIVAVRVYENGTGSLCYVLTDHLGSWEKVLDQSKNTVQQTHFDPWGNRMSYAAWNTSQTQTVFTFDRGFTGHEHYDCMHIINANARLYDPVIGRFFSPDPFVQAPDFTQGFNRYSYCMNNPVMYSDPDGESFTAAILLLGTIVGMYTGGTIANNSYNPLEWDYSSKKTWEYMIGGGLTGLASAGTGLLVAATDIAFCNTLGIIASSTVNSAGTWFYTEGKTDFTINFGIASYNFTKKEWGYIGKKDNHWLQNLGYALGGVYNILDIYRFFSWDILNYQDRFSTLNNYSNKKYGDITLEYGGKKNGYCAEYDPNTQTINIYNDALSKGWGWAKSSLGHEIQHYYDFNIKEYFQLGKEAYYHKLDYYAYYNEVQNAKYNGLSLYQYRQVMNSCYNNARMFGMQNMPQFSNYGFINYWSWLLNSLGL